MTAIPKLFSTLTVIDYGYWPMGPPDEPEDEEPEDEEPEDEEPGDEEPEKKCAALGSAQENWQMVEETKKPRRLFGFVGRLFRRNS